MKKFLFFVLFEYSIFAEFQNIQDNYDLLYEWGRNNSVFISYKIGMNYTNENTKNYYVNENIELGEILISIPKNILLNINSALKLSGPKIKKQHENYKKEKFDNNYNIYEVREDRKEYSFLAYLMTISNEKKSKKNKFYQFYKYLFNTFETDLDVFPTFYNSKQIKFLLFSLYGKGVIQTKTMIEEEFGVLQRNYRPSLDLEEYMKYRLFTINKVFDVSGVNYIIPFIDIFERNPINYNIKLNYTYNTDIINIIATKDIKPNDKLIMAMDQMPNIKSLIKYGKIYEENKDFKLDTFRVPLISNNFIKEKKLDPELSKGKIVDLDEDKYYEEVIPEYKKIAKMLNKEETKVSALNIFMENLEIIKNGYDRVSVGKLYEYFDKRTQVENIKSVLDEEKNYLDKKMKELEKIIKDLSGYKQSEFDL